MDARTSFDIVVIPGSPVVGSEREHRELVDWLNETGRSTRKFASVSNEAFERRRIDFCHGVASNVIHACSGLAQSTVSAHIATLIESGLLVSTRVGRWIFLSRNEEVIIAFAKQIRLHL